MEARVINDLAFSKRAEFQVVIIIEYDDGRMFPLTEVNPKCLLPLANKQLLTYQLDMLEKSGATGNQLVELRKAIILFLYCVC